MSLIFIIVIFATLGHDNVTLGRSLLASAIGHREMQMIFT